MFYTYLTYAKYTSFISAKFSPLPNASKASILNSNLVFALISKLQNMKLKYAIMIISTTGISRFENRQLMQ